MPAIWKGSLTFGLVNIPVELRAAVKSDHISFRLLHKEDMSPVKYERVSSKSGEPIPWEDIVKGYEYQKGKFVVLSKEDFETAALESSSNIDILDFVKEEEIDPRFFETPYYMVPTKGGEKAYALLRETIRDTESVGIGKIIMRQKQHLAAIKVIGDALVLEIMRFTNELVDASEYSFPRSAGVRPQERKMAQQLIGNLTESFDPKKYTDEYRANLMRLINAKLKGKKAKFKEPEGMDADDKVIDLMARLKASLASKQKESSRKSSSGRGSKSSKTTGKTVSKRASKSVAKVARRKSA